jgi:hypothetical protein
MKTKSEIESRIRELIVKELDRRVAEASERLPTRCVHNHRHTLDTRKQVGGEPNEGYNRITDNKGLPVIQTIGLCMLGSENPEEWLGTICEEPIDAKKCPVFNPLKGKDSILPELAEDLKNPGWVQENLPEVSSLLWVIGLIGLELPWWKRVWFWFRRIELEPVVPSIDTSKLLLAPPPAPPTDQ